MLIDPNSLIRVPYVLVICKPNAVIAAAAAAAAVIVAVTTGSVDFVDAALRKRTKTKTTTRTGTRSTAMTGIKYKLQFLLFS